ncbi:MAG: anthranilate synthase component I [Actinomycetota bacterium]|nr:anthranilate synthase component I [Actinomycetota bacterium]
MSAALMFGKSEPNLEDFRERATSHRVIPVSRTLLADGLTAIGLFETLCTDRAGTFLLESAEAGRSWSRYSFVGVRAAAMLTEQGGQARWLGKVPVGLPTTGDAWSVLRDSVTILNSSSNSNGPDGPDSPDSPESHGQHNDSGPRFTSGFVGCLAYDAVRLFEKLPDDNPSEVDIPDLAFLLATDLAVLDHFRGTVTLIAAAINFDATDERVDEAWHDAMSRLDAMQTALANPVGVNVSRAASVPTAGTGRTRSHTTNDEYREAVDRAQKYIREGDAFQIVLSQRYSTPITARALDVYRVLRSSNPSPYMYLIRIPRESTEDGGGQMSDISVFDVVGSSPEALVTVEDRQCTVHPIAGTRQRGRDAQEDRALALDLLADHKERAEHVMLVDLARNDLGRVCEPGSVDVTEFMEIERYSHVMHIVSSVIGRLKEDSSALDALRATFPAGTLSGAPKVRAMEIIDELEPDRRGLYGGVVGYVDFRGNLDMAIAIRTAVIQDGVAHVQAGAGIVADSDPEAEAQECVNKAGAVLAALEVAQSLAPVDSPGESAGD